jgi:hypothetical protein
MGSAQGRTIIAWRRKNDGGKRVATATGWVCKVCWKWNRPQDDPCYKCKTPRGVIDDAEVEAHRKVREAKANQPEPVPDIVVAVPVVVFRAYGRVWLRGGIGLLGLLALEAFAAVSDPIWFALTAGFAAAMIVCGFLAGEVAEGMRNREVWAFLVGIGLSVVAVIGSITAFSVFAEGLVNLNAVRWGSLLVFGGAGVAALVGLVMLFRHGRSQPAS